MLIVEPLAGFVARWWNRWRDTVEAAGGRADEWRFRMELPAIVAKLDRAAGLNHREITGRSLWLASSNKRSTGQQLTMRSRRDAGEPGVGDRRFRVCELRRGVRVAVEREQAAGGHGAPREVVVEILP